MHCFSLIPAAAALLASTVSAQSKAQIPPSFSPSSTTQLLESFQNNTVQITPGQQIGIDGMDKPIPQLRHHHPLPPILTTLPSTCIPTRPRPELDQCHHNSLHPNND